MRNLEGFREDIKTIEERIASDLQKVFDEMREEHGTTPIGVDIDIRKVQMIGERYAFGVVAGVSVDFDLEGSP